MEWTGINSDKLPVVMRHKVICDCLHLCLIVSVCFIMSTHRNSVHFLHCLWTMQTNLLLLLLHHLHAHEMLFPRRPSSSDKYFSTANLPPGSAALAGAVFM